MTIIDLKCVTRSYAKASRENIDKVAARFQADPQKMELLSILDEQVELLAKEGRPGLSRFFDSLEVLESRPRSWRTDKATLEVACLLIN
jgi:hypothetical protein